MSLLARNTPSDVYRRVELDARIGGSDPSQLVTLCYEQLIGSLGTALHADERGDNTKKSEGLTRAMSSVTALQLGVSGDASIAAALRHLYEATRKSLLDSVLDFDAGTIRTIRQDYIDILRAMNGAQTH